LSVDYSEATVTVVAGTVRSILLSLIVPPVCAACKEPELAGEALCAECRCGLVALPESRCLRCGAPTPAESPACRECRRRELGFDRAWSPFAHEGIARKAVAALKSRGGVAVSRLMAAELASRAPPGLLRGTLVPVPAHRRRRRRHGFNQAEAIAAALARETCLEMTDLLERTGAPRPQVGLTRDARLLNACGSVRVRAVPLVRARAVLVDDVYTTGATLDACARALKAAGATEVVAMTFARAVQIGT
jgi:ComF family protein